MKTRYILALVFVAAPLSGWIAPDSHAEPIAPFYADPMAPSPRDFYVNEWGGVNGCELAREAGDKAYCAGTYRDVRRDPDELQFDCKQAETYSEYAFCGKPLPVR